MMRSSTHDLFIPDETKEVGDEGDFDDDADAEDNSANGLF
jgi:hypothetical protein